MKCNNVINAMAHQADMLREIEEVIAHDEKQDSSAITPEEMAALKNYVSTMKTACIVATALAKHYAAKSKPAAKEEPLETDDPDEIDEPKDKPARARKKKETASSNKQAPPIEEPIEEDDDLDFLE